MYDGDPASIYYQIGGEETLDQLVNIFYDKVAVDPLLRPIFPDDFTEVKEKQRLFLTQFLGGPQLYSQQVGPPRMRARHLPFEITPKRAIAWLQCMNEAMDEVGLEGGIRELFFQRLVQVAQVMVNTPDDDGETEVNLNDKQ